jgi:hypothetical protein
VTDILHFTHIDHLPGIIQSGLSCDGEVSTALLHEVGNRSVKELRRKTAIRVSPGGHVSDYVPFYFAPRSPMLYAIHAGNVPEYRAGIDPLVYLVTSVEALIDAGLEIVITDRNAALVHAAHMSGRAGLAGIDWDLMRARPWFNTIEEPDRRERRMAECLAYRHVPWRLIRRICVRRTARATEVAGHLQAARLDLPVAVTPDWYF